MIKALLARAVTIPTAGIETIAVATQSVITTVTLPKAGKIDVKSAMPCGRDRFSSSSSDG
jgi:hypothetical protein